MNKNIMLFLLVSFFLVNCGSSSSEEQIEEIEIEKKPIIDIVKEEEGNVIDFKDVVIEIEKTVSIKILNTGDEILKISSIKLPNGFSSDWSSADINPNNEKILVITFLPEEIKEYSGEIVVNSNASNTISNYSIQGNGISSIYEGDVKLLSQEEVDNFGARGFTEINGSLNIGDPHGTNGYSFPYDVVNLEPLNNIKSIKDFNVSNTTLKSFIGMGNTIFEGSLLVFNNESLENLEGLSTKSILKGVNIQRNISLTSISVLNNVEEISYLLLSNNEKLLNLNGLNNLKTVTNNVSISGNLLIENLDELNSLVFVGGTLTISYNEALYSFCGIKPLLSSNGLKGTFYTRVFNRYNPNSGLILRDNDCLKEVPLDEYNGELRISGQSQLDRFLSKGYVKFDGSLILDFDNIDLEDLTKFNSLTSIKKLTIMDSKLSSLNGLENVKYVVELTFWRNSQLSNYCALSNEALNNVGSFSISDNLYNPNVSDLINGDCKQ